MQISVDDKCTFCKNEQETILHLFWTCPVTQQFFTQLSIFMKNKCQINFVDWTALEVLFGNIDMDKVINNILLQAKYHIYLKRNKKTNAESFKYQIKLFYTTEQHLAQKSFNMDSFEASWEKYKNIAL